MTPPFPLAQDGEITSEMTYERWQAQKADDRLRLREEFEANPQMVSEFWASWGKTPIEIDWDSIEELNVVTAPDEEFGPQDPG